VRPPCFELTEFLDTFCTVFVSFVSPSNRKIRVTRLLVTVRVFCLLKLRQNAPKLIILGTKNDFFPGKGIAPSTTSHPLHADVASPLLTEIHRFEVNVQYM